MSARLDGRSKHALTCLLVAALSFACAWFGPWRAVALPAAAVGVFSLSARRAAAFGALSSASAWVLMALVQDALVGFRLSSRIGGILQLPAPALIAYATTAAIAGALGALFAWSGFAVRDLVWGRGGSPAAPSSARAGFRIPAAKNRAD